MSAACTADVQFLRRAKRSFHYLHANSSLFLKHAFENEYWQNANLNSS